jgi:hypothetical protein
MLMNIATFRNALLIVLAALAIIPAVASAQGRDRAGRWEGTIQTRYTGSETVNFTNGSVANLGAGAGLGLGFAYNFDNKKSLGVDFSWSSADNTYSALSPSGGGAVNYKATGYTSALYVNGVYNFIDGPITPYINGFIGGIYFDTGVPDSVGTGCYWYPYYGYVCGPVTYSKTSTNFTYGAGIGVRWDINDAFFIKGGAQQQWFQVGGASGTPNFTVGRLDFGMKF